MSSDDNTQDQELLERYRRASESRPAAPSDAVRAAILAEGRRVAEQLKSKSDSHPFDVSKPAANDARWRLTAYGTAGAAVLAALLIAPRFWESTPATRGSAAVMSSTSQSAPAAPTGQDKALEEIVVAPAAPAAPRVAAAQKPAAKSAQTPAAAMESIVVTQSRRAENYQASAPIAAAPPEAARADEKLNALTFGTGADAATAAAATAGAARAARPRNSPVAVTLLYAAEAGDLSQTAKLLDQGAATNARDELGRTPLMLAVLEDRLEVARLLLSRGADPNIADKAGTTPLALAKQKNLPELVGLLERAGAR